METLSPLQGEATFFQASRGNCIPFFAPRYNLFMQIAAIALHLLLIAALVRRRSWTKLPYLSLIALMGLSCTPLLHYAFAHLEVGPYTWLYYAVDEIMAVLYVFSILQVRCTRLDAIAFSQTVYLTIKLLAWFLLWRKLDSARVALISVMRPLNLLFIAFWAFMVWHYGTERRSDHYADRP